MDVKRMSRGKLDKMYSVPMTMDMLIETRQKGIKPEHLREFIRNFGKDTSSKPKIHSDDWRKLRDMLERNPALQVVGQIGAGKTHLVKSLIKNDRNRVYIILDSHNEFDLPEINQLNSNLEESSKLSLPKEPIGAVAMFNMYKDLIRREKFPAHYVLVIEEALRYENKGLKVLLAECRKFIKVLAIMQEHVYTFCPACEIIPYNQFQL
jgi:hypothetical protein